jgi:hypothetical protein
VMEDPSSDADTRTLKSGGRGEADLKVEKRQPRTRRSQPMALHQGQGSQAPQREMPTMHMHNIDSDSNPVSVRCATRVILC